MSQQHAQFEEESRDGPVYQVGSIDPQPAGYTHDELPPISYGSGPGQKLQTGKPGTTQANVPDMRFVLAFFSLFFTFALFMVVISKSAAPIDFVFALLFGGIVVLLNLIFARRR